MKNKVIFFCQYMLNNMLLKNSNNVKVSEADPKLFNQDFLF